MYRIRVFLNDNQEQLEKAIGSYKGQKFVKNICKISELNRFQ
jgi:hypothetical protein